MEKKINWSEKAMAAKNATGPNGSKLAKLVALGKALVTDKALQEKDGKTHCDLALVKAARAFGYGGFPEKDDDSTANSLILDMRLDPKSWKNATATEAWEHACAGGLAVAYKSDTPHGHVAVVAPGERVWSPKWTAYAPPVYNVGPARWMNLKAPYTVGENFAFGPRPNHYVYLPQV